MQKELKSLQDKEKSQSLKRDSKHKSEPVIALVGYTNAGKSALVNLCTCSELESKNLLF